jgi:PAS domain S-box-containing protein
MSLLNSIKKLFPNLTLGQKIGFAFFVILFIMAAAMLSTHVYMSRIQQISSNTIEHRLPLTFMTLEAQNNLKGISTAINRYLLTENIEFKKQIEQKEERMDFFFDAIENYFEQDETDFEIIVVIDKAKNKYYKGYKKSIAELIEIHNDFYKRYPGLAYASENLNPLTLEFSGLINDMIEEVSDNEDSVEMLSMLTKIRYYWQQMGNYTRFYFTSKSEDTYQNALLYRNEVLKDVESLRKLDADISLGGIERLIQISRMWSNNMLVAMDIYNSDEWRGDIYYLKKEVDPVLDELDQLFHSLAVHQVSVANRYGDDLIGTVDNTKLLNGVLILLSAIVVITVTLALTRNISGRIRVLMGAAQRLANGDLEVNVDCSGKDDISQLSSSFNYMANRLKSTLNDNEKMTANLREKARYLEFQKLAMDAHAIVSITDRDGVIRYANDKFCEVSQYSLDELLGQSHNIVHSKFHSQSFWQKMWNTINNGKVWHGVVKNRNKSGEYYWVDTTIVPFLDATGKPYQFVSVRTDITERKNLQEKQQKRQVRMYAQQDALMELAKSTSLINGDLDASLREIIAKVASCMGASRVSICCLDEASADVCNDDSKMNFCPNLRYDLESDLYTDINGLKESDYPEYFKTINSLRVIRSDDVKHDVNLSEFYDSYFMPNNIASVIDVTIIHEGNMIGVLRCEQLQHLRHWHLDEQHFFVSMADLVSIAVSQASNKQAEKKIADFAAKLERGNRELQEALLLSREAEKMKSEFLSTMSHELRTPMNGIMGMLSLLQEISGPGEQKEYVQAAYSSAELLLKLLNDVLDFSKIDSNKIEIEHIEFSMRRVVQSVYDLMAVKASEKGIHFYYEVDDSIPSTVIGDPTRVRQVITNLVSNAIKFTENGEVAVAVSCIDDSAQHARIRVSVKDTGVGVPKENQMLIFDAFKQADGSITRKYGGTGLGLAICNKLVAIMGGEIAMHSEKDKGSEFFFDISYHKSTSSIYAGNSAGTRRHEIFVLDPDGLLDKRLPDFKRELGIGHWCSNADNLISAIRKVDNDTSRKYIFICGGVGNIGGYDINTVPGRLRDNGIVLEDDRIILLSECNPEHGKDRVEGLNGCLPIPDDIHLIHGCVNLLMSDAGQGLFVTYDMTRDYNDLSTNKIMILSKDGGLCRHVFKDGHEMSWVPQFYTTADEIKNDLSNSWVKLILLEASSLDGDPYSIIEEIRGTNRLTPILYITDDNDDVVDIANRTSLNIDVICKPGVAELTAIIDKWILRDMIRHEDDALYKGEYHEGFSFLEHQQADKIDELKQLMGDSFDDFIANVSRELSMNLDVLNGAIKGADENEICRLLNNVKNTASTIGLYNVTSYCDMLLTQIESQDHELTMAYIGNIGQAITNTLGKVS